jgi:RHS repeat-associated protein
MVHIVEEYRYDDNGNRTYEMNELHAITGRTFTHSVEDHTLTAGPISYEFDYDDNLRARTEGAETTQYLYSSTGELQRVSLPDNTLIEYINDPLGRRIAKKVNGAIEERYLWLDQTTLLAVYDGAGNLHQRFEYADDRVPYAMTQGGTTYYLAYDQVGSLRLITDNAGNSIKRVDYDSFGNIISDSNPSFAIPFAFAGGLHDPDTKLVRFGYRDYMPEIGKWTAKDPILFAGGDSNLYGYIENDPVNFIDPDGLRKLTFGQNAIVTVVSSAAAMGASFVGTPVAGAAAGATVGVLLTAAMGGDSDDMWNNGISGALGGLGGGVLGNLGKSAAGLKPGVGQAMGFLGGELLDGALLGSEPLVGDPCE